MGTLYPSIFRALSAPFVSGEVKTRAGAGGRQLSYITARTAMNRFDEAVGPENWRNRHQLISLSDGVQAVVCTIEIKVDGEWIAKEDVGGFKEMTERNRQGETVEDEENTVKTAYSDAFKRAAILWGVGRYLYGDGSAEFSDGSSPDPGEPRAQSRPTPQPPQGNDQSSRPSESRGQPGGNGQSSGPPRSGRALFAWTKEQEQRHQVGLLKYLNGWAKLQDYPSRMVDWDKDQVGLAYGEACRKLKGLSASPGDAYEEALTN